jgi:hypothetical protein
MINLLIFLFKNNTLFVSVTTLSLYFCLSLSQFRLFLTYYTVQLYNILFEIANRCLIILQFFMHDL